MSNYMIFDLLFIIGTIIFLIILNIPNNINKQLKNKEPSNYKKLTEKEYEWISKALAFARDGKEKPGIPPSLEASDRFDQIIKNCGFGL